MTHILKRTAAMLLALTLLVSALLLGGCSTPKVAMTVDGDEYTTGEYLAFLYNTFYQVYMQGSSDAMPLYYYEMYNTGTDIWGQSYTYENQSYDLAGYISALAQDTIVRQVAVRRLMAENGILLSEEDEAALKKELAEVATDAFIDLGFNNQSYARMLRECNYNEQALFYALYGEGGKKAVAETTLREFFDENYLSYKAITMKLQNKDGKDMTDKEKAAVKTRLEGYLAMYEEGKDFDAVIHKYEEDEKAADEKESSTTTTTTTKADGVTTTTTSNNTTSATTTTTTSETAATTTTAATTEDDKDEHEEHNHRVDITTKNDGELAKKLKEWKGEKKFNHCEIIEYTQDDIKYMALVLNLDPEADRTDEDGKEVDYFEQQKKSILTELKYDEMNDTIVAKMDTLKVERNNKAIKACDPYDFRVAFFGK